MRVLRIIARLNIGGPAIHTILLTRHMQSLGYETLLVTGQVGPGEGDMAYLAEPQGVQPIMIPQLGRRPHLAGDLVAFFRIVRLLFKFRPQIVHTHTAKAGTLGRLAAFLYNTVQSLRSTPLCLLQKISIVKNRNPQSLPASCLGPSASQDLGKRAGSRPWQAGAIPPGRRPIWTGGRNPKSKVVHTFHGHVLRGYFSPAKTRLFRGIEKILAKFTDAIVVVSEQQKEDLCHNFGIGHPDQYQVIPLGFNLTPFARSASNRGKFRAHLNLKDNGIRLVGIIGRLTPIKNHRLFLEAARLLITARGDTRTLFLIVGDGELRRDVEDLTQHLGLVEKVVFTGWIRDLAPLYADLDVVALTSDNEGTPVAVIEAMAARVPVIATDVGGVRELIGECGMRSAECGVRNVANAELKEGEFEICERGVLVKPGDVKGFAKGLRYLLEHPDVCREMGQRGREYAMKHHIKDRLVADMDRLYRSLLSDRQ